MAFADYLTGNWDELAASLHPDGAWLAYVSNQSGTDEVYVRSFPEPGPALPVSNGGGSEPMWDPDGRALFYRAPNGDVWSASIDFGPAPTVTGRERILDGHSFYQMRNFGQYDYDPATRRFVMVRIADGGSGIPNEELVVVTNWFEELRQRMGGG